MPHKQTNVPPRFSALAGWSALTVEGVDAETFLQAQTMNDVRALAPGRWQWNGWLNPKGRLIALFALARISPVRFVLLSPDMPADELGEALRRFVFRSKLLLAVAGERLAAGPPDALAAGAAIGGDDGRLALDLGGDGGARTLWVLPADTEIAADPAVDAAWRHADIAHGLPRLSPAQQQAWTPQMLSLERLAAFSLRKGCYPGQEIVARTHYLGQARRGLARLGGDRLAEDLAVTAADGRAVGSIVCTAADGTDALAVIAADAGDPLHADGRPLHRLSLNDGLARVT